MRQPLGEGRRAALGVGSPVSSKLLPVDPGREVGMFEARGLFLP